MSSFESAAPGTISALSATIHSSCRVAFGMGRDVNLPNDLARS